MSEARSGPNISGAMRTVRPPAYRCAHAGYKESSGMLSGTAQCWRLADCSFAAGRANARCSKLQACFGHLLGGCSFRRLSSHAHPGLAQCHGELMPIAARLGVSRVWPRDRAVQSVFRTMRIDPVPDRARITLSTREVDGAAMTPAPRRAAAAMQRVADARLESGCEALAIIVAEPAQDRPLKSSCIHCVSGMIELLAKIRVHSADGVFRDRQSHALGRGRILPGELAGVVPLYWLALINLPQVLIHFVHVRGTLAPANRGPVARVGHSLGSRPS